MARTEIRNASGAAFPLTPPLHGSLAPGQSVVVPLTVSQCRTHLQLDDRDVPDIRLTTKPDATPVTAGVFGPLDMLGEKVTGLGAPTADGDAATKAYVDGGGGIDATEVAYTPGETTDYPGTDPADSGDALDRLAARTDAIALQWTKDADDAAAADATAETLIGRVVRPGTIIAAFYEPSAALTAHDDDYATLALAKRDGAGGGADAVATLATQVADGSWTAFVHKSLGTLSNAAVVAGDVVTVAIAKTGNGVAVPRGTLYVLIEPADGA